MTLRRRLARTRLRYHALRHRHATWTRSLSRWTRAGLVLGVSGAATAVLAPVLGADVAAWSIAGGALVNQTLFALFDRPPGHAS